MSACPAVPLTINWLVKNRKLAKSFHVPTGTVKRYVKRYRDDGAKRFFTEPKRRSAGVLHGEVKEQTQSLLDQGKSVPEIAKIVNVKADTLHKAIGDGRLRKQKKSTRSA